MLLQRVGFCWRLLCAGACLLGLVAAAPFALAQAPQAGRGVQETLVSPEVHADRTVTFRLNAPKASEVTITGDWMATLEARTGGTAKMARGADGVWTFTSPPLEPTIHLYFFTIDGLNIADPVNPLIKLRNRTSGSLVEVPGDPVPVWQPQAVPRGTVDIHSQRSATYGDEHPFAVYLPPGYRSGTVRYPVLYLVHGGGDVYLSWVNAGAANVILDNLIAAKKAVPMIVVMPYNGSNYPNLPLEQGGPAGSTPPRFEQYMTKELMPFIDANYRTLADRKHRAMAGLSAGGGATFNVGLKHTELFSQFGLFSSGAITGEAASRYPELASGKAAEGKLDLLWISYGNQDPNHTGAEAFHAALTKNGVKHTYVTRDGGHVWPVWRWSLAEFAPLLFRGK
jgi:enterochelin esterase family protein